MHLRQDTFQYIASLMNKAKIEIAEKNYNRALDFYKRAEALFPQPIEHYTGACFLFYSMAELFLLMQNNTEALRYSFGALDCLDGINDAKVWYQSGLIYLRKNETETAKGHFKKAFAIGGKTVFTSIVQKEIDFFTEHIFMEDLNIVEGKH